MMKQEMLLSYVVLQTNLLYGCSCGEDDWNERCICVKECPFENVLRLGSPWELVAVLRARNQFFFGNRAFDLASVSRQVFEDVVEFTRIQDKLGTKSVFTQTAQLSFINVPCIWVEKNVCEEFQWACKYGVTWLQGNHYENLTTQKMECVFLDVVQSVNILVNNNGQIIHSDVVGALKMRTYLRWCPDKTEFGRVSISETKQTALHPLQSHSTILSFVLSLFWKTE
ncbi:hypothetical protein F8388_020026 [Cannabis sativa]|uniref:Uncharacterized protein n=1 Tax=Cannabis sativa TaxID=3483 RepID=A0A7J6ER24_CANSA|nr:hypothetical protein F8388_020026 [Cannabis sativa]